MSRGIRRGSASAGIAIEMTPNPIATEEGHQPVTDGASVGKKAAKVQPSRMLSNSLLEDLFHRLDSNKDGTLSMVELLAIVKKLKLEAFIDKDEVSACFKKVDKKGKGELNLNQFIAVYLGICEVVNENAKEINKKGSSFRKSKKDLVKLEKSKGRYAQCTRYGYDENGQYIFEVYTITDEKNPEPKIQYQGLPNKSNKIQAGLDKKFEEYDKGKKVSADWNGSLDDISKMIFDDAKANSDDKVNHPDKPWTRQILWWVDIALQTVSSENVLPYMNAFGLPNEEEFKNKFDSFDGVPTDDSSRAFIGNGIPSHGGGAVSSKTLFVQTSYMKNRPLAFALPRWLEFDFFFKSGFGKSISNYYHSKLAWLFNLSKFSGTKSEERLSSYLGAEELADRLRREDDDEEASDSAPAAVTAHGFRSGVPIPPKAFAHKAPPSWVMTRDEVGDNLPQLGFKSLSLTFLNQGFGSNCLITIRELDDENNKSAKGLDVKCALGQVGRIMSGVWRKLFTVTAQAGLSKNCAELDDSTGALAVFIILMTHQLSMNNMGGILKWLSVIESEVKELAVNKHRDHIEYIRIIVDSFKRYVEPIEKLISTLIDETHSVNESTKTFSIQPSEKHLALMKKGEAFEVVSSVSGRRVEVSYETSKFFWGNDSKEMARDLGMLVNGHEQLEVKGLQYWSKRLNEFDEALKAISDGIADKFGEKRDALSFTFTITGILMAPAAILTGYWGMNFDNMVELVSPYSFPATPGVQILWVVAGVIYLSLFLLCLHYRIFYSAS